MEIFELSEKPDYQKVAIEYFWKAWGNESNFNFYENCILNSVDDSHALPKFFIGIESSKIVCSYALLTNDLISRQDLMPWFACLYVDEGYRNRGYAEELLKHGIAQSKMKGFKNIYLSTDLINFYERKGWSLHSKGFNFSGEEINIYSITTN